MLAVPWEKLGPENTRILEHDSLTWGSLVGERRATVGQLLPTRITMRDYNPSRVPHALALAGGEARREVTLECGSVVKVVNDTSVYSGVEWFCDDIESSLPYCMSRLSRHTSAVRVSSWTRIVCWRRCAQR